MQKKQKIERPEEARFESTIELRNALRFRGEGQLHSEGRKFNFNTLSESGITSIIYRVVTRYTVSITSKITLVIDSSVICSCLTKQDFMNFVPLVANLPRFNCNQKCGMQKYEKIIET